MTTNPHPNRSRRRIRFDVTTPGDLPHPIDVDELAAFVEAMIARTWGIDAAVSIVYDSTQDPAS